MCRTAIRPRDTAHSWTVVIRSNMEPDNRVQPTIQVINVHSLSLYPLKTETQTSLKARMLRPAWWQFSEGGDLPMGLEYWDMKAIKEYNFLT